MVIEQASDDFKSVGRKIIASQMAEDLIGDGVDVDDDKAVEQSLRRHGFGEASIHMLKYCATVLVEKARMASAISTLLIFIGATVGAANMAAPDGASVSLMSER